MHDYFLKIGFGELLWLFRVLGLKPLSRLVSVVKLSTLVDQEGEITQISHLDSLQKEDNGGRT
jgi:hypothetical protein